jgi:hypothetical protein
MLPERPGRTVSCETNKVVERVLENPGMFESFRNLSCPVGPEDARAPAPEDAAIRIISPLARLCGRSPARWRGAPRTSTIGLLADKRRLVAEVRAMEERYGDRAVLRFQRKQLFWEYTVIESDRHFPIEVRYPRRYPFEPPRIISVLPLPRSPHQLLENELCWIDRVGGDWNPARDTAVTCINAAHRWLACLLVYLTLGQWPKEANEEFMRGLG